MKIKKYLDSLQRLDNKTILVTGANSGIGLEISRDILYLGGHLVMLCRSLERANKAKENLLKDCPDAKIDFIQYDQSSKKSIMAAVKEIKLHYKDFDTIVFNAGIMLPPKDAKDDDGYPLTISTNFIGLVGFLEGIMNILDDNTKERRLIFQGSVAAGINKKIYDSILNDKLTLLKQYNMSKQGVEILYYDYASNNDDPNLKFLLCEPGASPTPLFKNMHIPNWMAYVACHAPRMAALTAMKLITDDAENGDYYVPNRFFRLKGYPKKVKFDKRRYVLDYLIQAKYLWSLKK